MMVGDKLLQSHPQRGDKKSNYLCHTSEIGSQKEDFFDQVWYSPDFQAKITTAEHIVDSRTHILKVVGGSERSVKHFGRFCV